MITMKIKQRIVRKGRGAIFASVDFLDIGSRASVNKALSRLTCQGVIRRLARRLYDYPRKTCISTLCHRQRMILPKLLPASIIMYCSHLRPKRPINWVFPPRCRPN